MAIVVFVCIVRWWGYQSRARPSVRPSVRHNHTQATYRGREVRRGAVLVQGPQGVQDLLRLHRAGRARGAHLGEEAQRALFGCFC